MENSLNWMQASVHSCVVMYLKTIILSVGRISINHCFCIQKPHPNILFKHQRAEKRLELFHTLKTVWGDPCIHRTFMETAHVAIVKHAWKCYNCKLEWKMTWWFSFIFFFPLRKPLCLCLQKRSSNNCSVYRLCLCSWLLVNKKKKKHTPDIGCSYHWNISFFLCVWPIKIFTELNLKSNRSECCTALLCLQIKYKQKKNSFIKSTAW